MTDAAPNDPKPLHRGSLVIGLIVGALAAAVATGAAFALLRDHPEAARPAFDVADKVVRLHAGVAQPLQFVTAPVEEGAALPRPAVTARVAAIENRSSSSFAPLEGRVERVMVVLGDRVQRGTLLVQVRSGDLATMLRELRADILTAQTKKALVDRLKFLVETRAASANDLLVAQNEYEEAQLAAKAADSRLKSLAVSEQGDNLYGIVATRPGTVIQLDAQPGREVGPTREKPVVTVADLDEVLVLADVPQRDTGGMTHGMTVQIRIPGGDQQTLPGKVETVSEVVDPERQTVPVRIRVANPTRALRPNAFVEAVFPTDDRRPILQVPSDGVVSDGLDSVVFVESEKGIFHRRAVTVGRQTGGRTEILSGLKPGERVVIRGALLLLNAVDLEG